MKCAVVECEVVVCCGRRMDGQDLQDRRISGFLVWALWSGGSMRKSDGGRQREEVDCAVCALE